MSNVTTFNPSQEYVNALLCKVAYEYLPSGFDLNNLTPSNFSSDEIAYLKANYRVIDGLESSNGFDGTWLAKIDNFGRQTGEAIFAIAGTDPRWGIFFDLDDDYYICKKGIATEQFIEAYNYYMRMGNAQGTIINQIIEGKPDSGAYLKIPDGNYGYKYYTVIEMSNTNKNGGFSDISITGHSLGGHLAGLLGMITGYKTTIFNAPSYFVNPIGNYNLEYVFIDNEGTEHSETLTSDYQGFIEKFFGSDLNQSSITHIYNSNNLNIIANLGWHWITNKGFDCLNQHPNSAEAHSIISLSNAYYAYQTIKDIINDDTENSVFLKEKENATSQTAFENVYKAYCSANQVDIEELDYSNSIQIQGIISDIADWIKVSQENGINIKIDVYYKDETEDQALIGTVGDDILYGGDGNNLIKGGTGNDTYIFRKGDEGTLIVEDNSAISGEKDKIIFDGLEQKDVKFTVNGANLEIYTLKEDGTKQDTASVIIKNFFKTSLEGTNVGFIEEFQFQKNGETTIVNKNQGSIKYEDYNGNQFFGTDFVEEVKINIGSGEYHLSPTDDNVYLISSTPAKADIYLENSTATIYAKLDGVYNFYCNKNNQNTVYMHLGISNSIINVQNFSNHTSFAMKTVNPPYFKYAKLSGKDVIFMIGDTIEEGTLVLKGASKYYDFYGHKFIDLRSGGNLEDYSDMFVKSIIFPGSESPKDESENIHKFPTRIYYPDSFENGEIPEKIDYNLSASNTENVIIEDPRTIQKIVLDESMNKDSISFYAQGTSFFIKPSQNAENYIEIKYYTYLDALNCIEFSDGSFLDVEEYNYISYQQDIVESPDNLQGTDGKDIIYALGGDDSVQAGGGEDIIYGGDGNDTIYSGDGNDFISGDSGNDIIFAGKGDDTILAGKGNDNLYGGAGNDTYYYNLGDGNDIIADSSGEYDTIVFGEGISREDLSFSLWQNSLLIMIEGEEFQAIEIVNWRESENRIEKIVFADGSEFDFNNTSLIFKQYDDDEYLVNLSDLNSTIYAEGGNDHIEVGNGNNNIYGGSGNDTIIVGSGDNYIDSGSEDDTITVGNGNNYIIAGTGNDEVYLNNGQNILSYNLGDGFDKIYNANENTKIVFGENISLENLRFKSLGNDLYVYVNGDENSGFYLSEYFISENRIKTIEFANGSIVDLYQTAKTFSLQTNDDEVINTGNGNNTIIAAGGNDEINGGTGDDTYIWNLGDGFDTINDVAGNDTIVLGEGITENDLKFIRIKDDLYIYIKNNSEEGLLIKNYSSSPIETIKFFDGSITDIANIAISAPTLISGDIGDNYIVGTNGDDIIDGGKGNDTLYGGDGNDTYVYNIGDGFDIIYDFAALTSDDTILFGEGISKESLTFTRGLNPNYESADDLLIFINGDENQGIRISQFFSNPLYKIETIKFADGSEMDISKGLKFTQTDADENILTTEFDDIIIGNGGNDEINGGTGNDTYIWNLGDGFDTINDYLGENLIKFGEGISKENLSFRRDSNDLIIFINDDETQGMRIKYHFSNDEATTSFQTIYFADGSTFDLTKGLTFSQSDIDDDILATKFDDIIIGGKGNDRLNGGSGSDTYIYNLGDGFDEIAEYGVIQEDINNITFGEGISFENLKFRISDISLIIYIGDDETQGIKIYNWKNKGSNIEKLIFADGNIVNLTEIGLTINSKDEDRVIAGTVYDDTIYAGNLDTEIFGDEGNDIIFGGDGNDNIFGGYGDDIISGGKGDDAISGNEGNNTYVYNLGDGFDTIKYVSIDNYGENIISFGEGISLENLSFRREYDDLKMFVNGDETQGINIQNYFRTSNHLIEEIKFFDGSVFELNKGLMLSQTDENENIIITSYDDIVAGNGGNDYIYDYDGNDTYIYNLGDGFDDIYDISGNNKIKFGEGISKESLSFRIDNHGMIIIINGDETQGIRLLGHNSSQSHNILAEFTDGTTLDLYKEGLKFSLSENDDILCATEFDDIIIGNKGDDTLYGAAGNDTYIYNLGDGFDTIEDYEGLDEIIFGEGITKEDLSFKQIDDNLIIMINGDETQGIKIYNQFSLLSHENTFGLVNYKIEKLEFADGTSLDISNATIEYLNNYSSKNTFVGTDSDDIFNGTENDEIFIGGKGNDTLYGGAGNDTYIYNLGDGVDYIYDTNGSDDKIIFGEGISFDDLKFSAEKYDLFITIKYDQSQGIRIKDWNYVKGENDYRIRTFVFADGSEVHINDIGLTFIQSNGNDSVHASYYDDIIHALGGDDYVNTKEGNDIIFGGTGNDTLYGGYGNDTYVYNLGDGFDTITDIEGFDTITFGEGITKDIISLQRDGNDLILNFNNDAEQGIRIRNYYYNNYKIETFRLYDGTLFDIDIQNVIEGTPDSETLFGTDQSDIIYGFEGDDMIDGNGGNDIIVGGKGNDDLYGGEGDDKYIYDLGDGNDYIKEIGGEDTIVFGKEISREDVDFVKYYDFLYIIIKNKNQIVISNHFTSTEEAVEKFSFSDGTILDNASMEYNKKGITLIGTEENDNLIGTSDNDIFNGGHGDDTIKLGYGNDTLIYNLGDGFDTISNNLGENDKIVFGENITLDNLIFKKDGNNLIIYVNDETQGIKIMRGLYTFYAIDTLNFSDGSSLNYRDIIFSDDSDYGMIVRTVDGTDENDILIGSKYKDYIYGNYGDDILSGGKENDTLMGGPGNDTYIYNLGDGFDEFAEIEGEDKIIFGEGISKEDLSFIHETGSNNLIIQINYDTNQGIKIMDFFDGYIDLKIEKLEFSDGTSIDISTYNSSEQLIQAMGSFGSLSSSNLSLGIQEFQIIENVITANSLKGTAA